MYIQVTKLFYLEGLKRVDVQTAHAGEIVSMAGCEGGVYMHLVKAFMYRELFIICIYIYVFIYICKYVCIYA
jgi:hypothetical protein